MQFIRIFTTLAAVALCAPAFAEPQAIADLSGDIRIAGALDLTYRGDVSFRAELRTLTGKQCQLLGTVAVSYVSERALRQVSALAGKTMIYCAGEEPVLVSGHFAVPVWTPPQAVKFNSGNQYGTCTEPNRYRACKYSAISADGAQTKWVTWHALSGHKKIKKV